MGWNINSHLPHNFLLPYRDLSPIFLFSSFASCCHSHVPAFSFSVVVLTPIGRSASSTRFFIPMRFVFLDRLLDYPSFLSVEKLCIKMKMYKRSIENGGGFGSEIATGFH
ncbi:hypothetical protein S83_012017 [Arachis hypogaea]